MALRWSVQKKKSRVNRDGHTYWQLVIEGRPDDRKPTVGLGYLSDEEASKVKERMADAPDRLFHSAKPEIKVWAPHDGGEIAEKFLADAEREAIENAEREAASLAARAACSGMTLRQFYTAVWTPKRRLEHPATWAREDRSRWPHILRALGTKLVSELNETTWIKFLEQKTSWGNHSRRLAQNEYKLLLGYAKVLKVIEAVHALPEISRENKREVEPLLPHEVMGVIACASDLLHKALFALAFGQGARAGEPGLQHWEDIDWDSGLVRLTGGTKTKDAKRRVALADLSVYYLRLWWEECGRPAHGPCFPWRKGYGYDPARGKPIKSWRTALKSAARRCGGEELEKRVFPNLARHTFATIHAVSAMDRDLLRRQMRHSGRSTILEEAYIKATEQQDRIRALEQLASYDLPSSEGGPDTDTEVAFPDNVVAFPGR